jgi:hypothetical protein
VSGELEIGSIETGQLALAMIWSRSIELGIEDIEEVAHLMFREALKGIKLGAYDEQVMAYLERAHDMTTLVVIASVIARAKKTGR